MRFIVAATILLGVVYASAHTSAAPHYGNDDQPKSMAAKNASVLPVQRDATECVLAKMRVLLAHPTPATGAVALGDYIVDAVQTCANEMRSMIRAYDRSFGDGEGELFFMGPYLDLLPTMIEERLQDTAGH